MKVEEAISRVEIAFGYSTAIHDDWKLDDEAEKIAIEAMRKQDPMRPLSSYGECTCICGKLVEHLCDSCSGCGQKLDWTKEDD